MCFKTRVLHKPRRGGRRIIEKELEGFGIRLNKKRPEIMFKKKDKGGMAISVSPGSASAPCPPRLEIKSLISVLLVWWSVG